MLWLQSDGDVKHRSYITSILCIAHFKHFSFPPSQVTLSISTTVTGQAWKHAQASSLVNVRFLHLRVYGNLLFVSGRHCIAVQCPLVYTEK